MTACAETAAVVFSFYESRAGCALLPGGEVTEIVCVDPAPGSSGYAWGTFPCL